MTTATSTPETKDIEETVAASASPFIATSIQKSKLYAAKSLFTVKKSTKFAWHAWLGTAATAEENVVSLAKTMAAKGSAMAAKGSEIETKAVTGVNEQVDKVKSKSTETKAKLTGLSKGKIDSVEKYISKGLNKSLHAVGVPTRGDMDKLALLMNEMSKSIEELTVVSETKTKRSASKSASA